MADVLIVDLDGTLIKTDMLHESFWSSVKRNPSTAFLALISLVYGKAALKPSVATPNNKVVLQAPAVILRTRFAASKMSLNALPQGLCGAAWPFRVVGTAVKRVVVACD